MSDYTHIQCESGDGFARVAFPLGRFDGHAVRELFEFSNDLGGESPRLLVDCSGVEFVPSGGMGMLTTIHKRYVSNGGQLHIAIPDEHAMRSFKTASLDRFLHLFDSAESARAAFKT